MLQALSLEDSLLADFLLTFCRFDNSRVSIVNGYGFSKELLGNRNTAIQSYTIGLFHMTSANSGGETTNELLTCYATKQRATEDKHTLGEYSITSDHRHSNKWMNYSQNPLKLCLSQYTNKGRLVSNASNELYHSTAS